VIGCDCAEGIIVDKLPVCVLYCLRDKWRDEAKNNFDKNERMSRRRRRNFELNLRIYTDASPEKNTIDFISFTLFYTSPRRHLT